MGDLSNGDEITGLSRAFIYAGSPAIIVSLWKVDDASTSLLMTRLHQYIASGYEVSNALSRAQKDLMDMNFGGTPSRGLRNVEWTGPLAEAIKVPKKHPYYWAPFVLISTASQD